MKVRLFGRVDFASRFPPRPFEAWIGRFAIPESPVIFFMKKLVLLKQKTNAKFLKRGLLDSSLETKQKNVLFEFSLLLRFN